MTIKARLLLTALLTAISLLSIVGLCFYIIAVIDDLSNDYSNLFSLTLTLSIIFIGSLSISFYLLMRALIKPINSLKDTLARVSESFDFTEEVKSENDDEIGEVANNVNNLLNNLKASFIEILASATNMTDFSEELSHSSKKISRNTKIQTDASNNMAAAVEEMTSTISVVSQQTSAASQHTHDSSEVAEHSTQVILETVNGIEEISRSVETAAERITALREDSENISDVANIIQGIAGQTNLLALNAAIEAARAGEQGRGFAVVADEVRNLSESTTKSTQDINTLLSRMHESAQLAVESMLATEQAVKQGVKSAQQAGDSITEIQEGSNAAAVEVAEISNAIKEQEEASAEIAKNIDQIAQMSEQNTESVAQSIESIEQVYNSSRVISDVLSRYKVSENQNEKIKLRVTDILSDDFPSVQALHFMGEELQKRSDGRISLKVFSGGSFGTEPETLVQLENGSLDMARVNISQLNGPCPETMIPTLPFLFNSVAHMHKAVDGNPGRLILDAISKTDYIGLGLYDSGARNMYTTKPIKSIKDVSGLKLRVPPSPLWEAIADAMGAYPAAFSIDEINMAINTGLVDAAENNIFAYEGFEHFKACTHFSLTEHVIAPDVLVFSKKLWEKLSEEDQQIINESAQASVLASRRFCEKSEKTAMDKVKKQGATIVSHVDKESFQQSMQVVYNKFVTNTSQKDLLKQIKDMR